MNDKDNNSNNDDEEQLENEQHQPPPFRVGTSMLRTGQVKVMLTNKDNNFVS